MARFGFNDKELTTPEHDKILLWLNMNWRGCIKSLKLIVQPTKIQRRCYRCQEECNWDWEKGECQPSYTRLSDKEKIEWKENLKKQYILCCNLTTKSMFWSYIFDSGECTIEYPIMGYNNYNVGFVDLYIKLVKEIPCGDLDFILPEWKEIPHNFYFEIKPEIKSIGETIRQVNFYRSHQKGTYVIVTKTKGLKELFEEQDIYVYEYEDLPMVDELKKEVINNDLSV